MDRPASWRSLAIDLEGERRFHIGGATVDPISREASYAGQRERLQPQTLKVLIALVRRRGEVVTRSELVDSCWNGRIVGEDVINRSISVLRDFASRAGCFSIETVPKAGYRLVESGARLERLRHWSRKSATFASLLAVAAGSGLVYYMRTVPAEPPRIAVLPFGATGVEPALAEGISDELLSQLSRSRELRVIGRTSSNQFKDKAEDLRSIGRKLDVQYIVEGNVRSSRDRLHISVSLVKTKDGSAVWARTFNGSPEALQPVQAAIGSQIGQSLGVPPIAIAKSTPDGRAYTLYLRAKSLMRDRDSDGLPNAVELLRQAIRIDPGFAGAWAQLAAASDLALEKEVVVDLGGPKPIRMSKHEAAEHALRLDPNLAEGHAILGMLERPTIRAKAHLRRALELVPGDTQARYWWASTVAESGDYRHAGELMRQTAALDPLWKRPVVEAVSSSLARGDRAAALRYLRTIKAGNPKGAVEVEVQMAFSEADFSRVVELELARPNMPWDAAKARAIRTLISLGYWREALLIWGPRPFAKSVLGGQAPPLPVIMERIRNDAQEGDDLPIYAAVSWELARERRWHDLAAIYHAGVGLMGDVKGSDPGGRYYRQLFAPIYSLALNRADGKPEAIRLARAAEEGAEFMLAKGEVPPELLVPIAAAQAILGRKEDALDHLEQAFSLNWRLDEFVHFRLGDRPEFATLRGHPRFERLRRIQDAHIAKERREVEALGIF